MSKFLLPYMSNSSTSFFQVPEERRCQPPQYCSNPEAAGTFEATAPFTDALLWPRTRFCGPDMSMGMLTEDATVTGRWAIPPQEGGSQTQLKITGITKDGNGNPLGSCLVRAYAINVPDNDEMFVAEVTSDSGGYFELITKWPGLNHFLVCYKSGSPDYIGASVRTLLPV